MAPGRSPGHSTCAPRSGGCGAARHPPAGCGPIGPAGPAAGRRGGHPRPARRRRGPHRRRRRAGRCGGDRPGPDAGGAGRSPSGTHRRSAAGAGAPGPPQHRVSHGRHRRPDRCPPPRRARPTGDRRRGPRRLDPDVLGLRRGGTLTPAPRPADPRPRPPGRAPEAECDRHPDRPRATRLRRRALPWRPDDRPGPTGVVARSARHTTPGRRGSPQAVHHYRPGPLDRLDRHPRGDGRSRCGAARRPSPPLDRGLGPGRGAAGRRPAHARAVGALRRATGPGTTADQAGGHPRPRRHHRYRPLPIARM